MESLPQAPGMPQSLDASCAGSRSQGNIPNCQTICQVFHRCFATLKAAVLGQGQANNVDTCQACGNAGLARESQCSASRYLQPPTGDAQQRVGPSYFSCCCRPIGSS